MHSDAGHHLHRRHLSSDLVRQLDDSGKVARMRRHEGHAGQGGCGRGFLIAIEDAHNRRRAKGIIRLSLPIEQSQDWSRRTHMHMIVTVKGEQQHDSGASCPPTILPSDFSVLACLVAQTSSWWFHTSMISVKT